MRVKLYWFAASHPSMAARAMLDLKGIDYETVTVLPGMQQVHLRLAGFRGGTVPALKLDGRRVQGSRRIARALDELQPEPPLFGSEPEQRARVEEAERWGEEELQNVPRVLLRWGLVRHLYLRRWLGEQSNMPLASATARISGPAARYYARLAGADDAGVRRALEQLPGMLRHADALLAEGTLALRPANAAALQILSSVRALAAFSDLAERVERHPVVAAARELFPAYPGPVPAFLPQAWLDSPEQAGEAVATPR